MAFQKTWPVIAPISLIADGGQYGQISITSTVGIKVQQIINLASNVQTPKQFEVKQVLNATDIIVGAPKGGIKDVSDVRLYLMSQGAFIFNQEAQNRPAIPPDAYNRAAFEEEPTNAFRTFAVDYLGNAWSTSNPFPVRLSDGSINVQTLNAELNVQLSAKDNDPVAGNVHSSVRIGGQTTEGSGAVNEMVVNPDGSINVIVENPSAAVTSTKYTYAETTVTPGLQTTVVTYTVPAGRKATLEVVYGSGENIGRVDLTVNSTVVDTVRIMYGSLNCKMNFLGNGPGMPLVAGDIVRMEVTHNNADPTTFNGRIQATEAIV